MRKVRLIPLFLSIFLCFFAAAVGSYFTTPSIKTWYVGLQKPFFNPPNWIFGPVWSLLYIMMGISLYLVWILKEDKDKRTALVYFFIQLALNSLWSILFFGLHEPLFASIEILVLWFFIFFTIRRFLALSQAAGKLLIPYLMWVTFATILNASIVILNWTSIVILN